MSQRWPCFGSYGEDGGLLASFMLCPLAAVSCSQVNLSNARLGTFDENRQVTEHSEPGPSLYCLASYKRQKPGVELLLPTSTALFTVTWEKLPALRRANQQWLILEVDLSCFFEVRA